MSQPDLTLGEVKRRVTMVEFRAYGIPVPQGSKRAFLVRGKDGKPRPTIVDVNRDTLGDWRSRIATAASEAAQTPFSGPVGVTVRFLLPRPQSLPKRVSRHAKRPDVDKLLRALLDAITGIVILDDAQVCEIRATKAYATPGERVGCDVLVEEFES